MTEQEEQKEQEEQEDETYLQMLADNTSATLDAVRELTKAVCDLTKEFETFRKAGKF